MTRIFNPNTRILKGKVEYQPLVSIGSFKDEKRVRPATTTNPASKGQRMIKKEQARVDSTIEVIDRMINSGIAISANLRLLKRVTSLYFTRAIIFT